MVNVEQKGAVLAAAAVGPIPAIKTAITQCYQRILNEAMTPTGNAGTTGASGATVNPPGIVDIVMPLLGAYPLGYENGTQDAYEVEEVAEFGMQGK